MRSPELMGDSLAPITSCIGFLRATLEQVSASLLDWRQNLYGNARMTTLEGGLAENFRALEPLTLGTRPRELVVATKNPDWVAIFDCGAQGGDPDPALGYLCGLHEWLGISVVSIPDMVPPGERLGARQFEIFSPSAGNPLNSLRHVSVVQDFDRWQFDLGGDVQPFEELEAYKRRRVSQRFTHEMLEAYAGHFDLRVFDDDFFCGPCNLVESGAEPRAHDMIMTLAQARDRLSI